MAAFHYNTTEAQGKLSHDSLVWQCKAATVLLINQIKRLDPIASHSYRIKGALHILIFKSAKPSGEGKPCYVTYLHTLR